MDGQRVSLGCGTLILIALIVLIFSNAGDGKRDLRPVIEQLDKLEHKLDDVERQLRDIKRELEQSRDNA
jgi:hypothetical protein